jgi:hypothetical protein
MQELTQDKYRKLQRIVEEAKAEAERRKGTLDELSRQLKERFECSTVAEARQKLAQLRAEHADKQRRFNKALKRYEEKWQTEEV